MNYEFWIYFFWLQGCLSLSLDCKESAFKHFNIALSILKNSKKAKSSGELILLPHTKYVKLLIADRILRELHLIRLEYLLWNNDENINKITHTEFMYCNMMVPATEIQRMLRWRDHGLGRTKGVDFFFYPAKLMHDIMSDSAECMS